MRREISILALLLSGCAAAPQPATQPSAPHEAAPVPVQLRYGPTAQPMMATLSMSTRTTDDNEPLPQTSAFELTAKVEVEPLPQGDLQVSWTVVSVDGQFARPAAAAPILENRVATWVVDRFGNPKPGAEPLPMEAMLWPRLPTDALLPGQWQWDAYTSATSVAKRTVPGRTERSFAMDEGGAGGRLEASGRWSQVRDGQPLDVSQNTTVDLELTDGVPTRVDASTVQTLAFAGDEIGVAIRAVGRLRPWNDGAP